MPCRLLPPIAAAALLACLTTAGCLVTGDAPYDQLVRWRSYETLPADLLADDLTLAARHAEARAAAEAHPVSAATRSPAATKTGEPSRLRRSAGRCTRRPTCTTAAWRRSWT